MLLLCALIVGSSSVWGQTEKTLSIDFESAASTYTDWTFTNIISNYSNSGVAAHGGSKYGCTDGKTSGTIVTKSTIKSPISITFYVTKESNNTTASWWRVSVSEDGTDWTQVGDDASACSMSKGTWIEVTQDLSSYSDVYVKVEYDGTSAKRDIDDIALTYSDEVSGPDVTLSATSLDFGKVNYGETKSMTFTVTPANLSSDLSLSCNNAKYEVTPTSIASSVTTATTITVTAKPTALNDNMDGTITISDGGLASNKTVLLATTVGDPNLTYYDFTNIAGFSSWTNSYSQHVVEYNDATVTFASAGRQTATITDRPVTKGGDVTIVLTNDTKVINSVTFVCQQWSDKAQTITLHYSIDGGNSYTSTGITSTNFTISDNNLPEGTNAVKITFSSSSNQVGITSATLSLGDASTTTSPLDHITLSGNYPTEFTQGDTFSHEGMVVTATYEDNSTKNVTNSAEFTGYNMSTTGNQTVTVSYTENEVTKTATYDITVAEKLTTNDFVKVTDANTLRVGDQLILVYEEGNLALGAINSGGKYYESASVTINEGVITDPTGVAVLTLGGEKDAWTIKSSLSGNYLSLTSNSNELKAAGSVSENSTENWTITIGNYVKVINNAYPQKDDKDRYIQWNSGSTPRFACYTGTQNNLQLYRLSKSVTITSAEYATYCGNKALNFDGVGIKAFTATDNGTSVKLNEITQVPANTPVVLYKAGGGTVDVPVIASAEALTGNDLKIATEDLHGNGKIYVLNKVNEVVGFYKLSATGTLEKGKAYLESDGNAPFLGFDGDDETTGIQNVERTVNDNQYYTLDGRRVAEPTKGIYIFNGKKVVIK